LIKRWKHPDTLFQGLTSILAFFLCLKIERIADNSRLIFLHLGENNGNQTPVI